MFLSVPDLSSSGQIIGRLAFQVADEIGVDGCQAGCHSQGDAGKEPGRDPNDDLTGSG